jgi:hypothetical protein
MTLLLDLRDKLFHAVPLVHQTSEHVVLANVFGILKNFAADAVFNPWLATVMRVETIQSKAWKIDFWERQARPIGPVGEGNTEVDVMLESDSWLVFIEVKMDAEPSRGTKSDPERNQLSRLLDIGYLRARGANKSFAMIYVTPDISEPNILERLRKKRRTFPANAEIDPDVIYGCMFWSPWSQIGDVLAVSYGTGKLDAVEKKFALDLLAYLCLKRLWKNTLDDDPLFYTDKLYRSLCRTDSPFVPYGSAKPERYQGWRTNPWEEAKLRSYLNGLRLEDRALLKLLADAGGALLQRAIMKELPLLEGKSGALRRLKSHVNEGCRQLDCAQILAEGYGSGPNRIHEINRNLGELRAVVIAVAKEFEIDWHLLER